MCGVSIRGTGNALLVGGKVRYYPNTPMGGISRQRSGRVIARVDEAGAEGHGEISGGLEHGKWDDERASIRGSRDY